MADINLYARGNVIIFNGVGGGSNYYNIVGQTTNDSELINRICGFMHEESKKRLFLRSMTFHEPLSKKISEIPESRLEKIRDSLKEKGINLKLVLN